MKRFLLSLMLAIAAGGQTKPAEWRSLFDGKTLGAWKETPFTNRGEVRVTGGSIMLLHGEPLTGVTFSGEFPKVGYEIRFEAAKIKGGDFFASLTFPVGDSFATLVTGGWGGDIVGISNIDGWDASENETRTYFEFEPSRWYAFRLRVTADRIQVWIDEKQAVNVGIAGRAVSLRRGDIRLSAPLGFASYNTTGAIRKIEFR